jgi:hypothetical protein
MPKQNLNIGSAANDGTGDSLRDGAIKLNSIIDELYTALGNDTNLQISVGTPASGQFLKWNGTAFVEGGLNALSEDLSVNGHDIISSSNGDITLKPNGTGDIKFWTGSTGAALTIIDGADGKLKWSNHFDDVANLPDATTYHGMFAHAHSEGKGYFAHAGNWIEIVDVTSGIGKLSDVDMTVGGGPSDGQVLKWQASTSKWIAANDETASGGGGGTTQNLFEGFTADSGSTTASAATDVLTVAGGTNISTSISGDTLTINMTGTLGDPAQNLYSVIGSDSGNKTATSQTSTINFVGGSGVSTAISGDNLTITNDSPNVSQEVYKTVTGDTGTTTAQLATSTLSVVGAANHIASAVTSNTVTLSIVNPLPATATEGDTLIYDEQNGVWVVSESPSIGFTVSSSGSSSYRFTGGGVTSSTDNPTIYVYRGFTYRFYNSTGAGHPFALRQTSGGTAVTNGVTGTQTGVQYWTVPQTLAAGTTYVYQCTLHSAMVGNLVVV